MRWALRMTEDRDQVKAEIRDKIDVAMESLRQRKGIGGEAFMAQLEAELDAEIEA